MLANSCIKHLNAKCLRYVPQTFTCIRNYASLLERERKIAEREDNVFQYAEMGAKRPNYVFVWGNATTGALGVREFVKPPKGVKKKPKYQQISPYRQTFFDQYLLRVQDVACGYGYSIFLCKAKDDRSYIVYGCGINTDSQLGYQEYPKNSGRILDYVTWPAVIDIPLVNPDKTKFTQVSCGRAHTFILSENEGLFSFGNNSYGQCGRNVVEGEKKSGNKLINKIPFEHGEIKQVECGQDHTLLLTHSGEVYSCGLSSDGQTGVGHYDNVEAFTKVTGDIEGEKIVQISSKVDCALAVSENGDIFGWGNSEYDQLSIVSKETTQVNVSRHLPFKNVGKVHKAAAAGSMCGLVNDHGLLYNWGKNRNGCLGFGHKNDQAFPYQVSLGVEVIKVASGVDHMVVLSKSVV